MMQSTRPAILGARLLACLSFLSCLAAADPSIPLQTGAVPAPGRVEQAESYRVRIGNTQYGPVEISADQGRTWLLVARVTRPATKDGIGAGSNLPAVVRSGPQGMAFGIGGGRLVRLLPDSAVARRDFAAILCNALPTDPFFADLLPPVGSPVQQVIGRAIVPLPAEYAPEDGDVLQLTVGSGAAPDARQAERVRTAADKYRESALAALRKRGGKPSTGVLTINARLALGDDPQAVLFYRDGAVVAILNRPPFTVKWNTRDVENGEYLLEVRALDKTGAVMTRTKALIYVENLAAGPP